MGAGWGALASLAPMTSRPAPATDTGSTHRRPRVLLATFDLMPDGEAGGHLLVEALERRGVDAAWAVWSDPSVDWAAADLVAVRSTWDYHRRPQDFLAWARATHAATRLLNGAEVFAWNADKAYLTQLPGLGLPAVPTDVVVDGDLVAGLDAGLERWGATVIKPSTGAGGVGVVVVEEPADGRLQELTAGPWVVQPLVASVRTLGETSVYVIGGRAVAQAAKSVGDAPAAAGEVRVHPRYGGSTRVVDLDPALAELATRAIATAGEHLGAALDYARVDLVHHDGAWVISELELIEPSLYLDVLPENAERLADVVVDRLS